VSLPDFAAVLKRWEGGYEVHLFSLDDGSLAGVTQCVDRDDVLTTATDYLALSQGVLLEKVRVVVLQTVVNDL
jgi:hypothetical protein